MISTLWCEVCRRYEGRLCGKKNFSKAWIDGSTNHRTSNITDHACSEQHKSAMALLCRDQARSKREPITTYSPIARSLLSTALSPAVRDQMKKKFEISFRNNASISLPVLMKLKILLNMQELISELDMIAIKQYGTS